jgi:hypothetical protein
VHIVAFGREEWIVIQPQLQVNGENIRMDELIVQTVLPWQLGRYDRWLSILEEQTNLGYNSFHFPPVA